MIQHVRQLRSVTLDIAYFIHSLLENIYMYFDEVLFSTLWQTKNNRNYLMLHFIVLVHVVIFTSKILFQL